MKVSEASDERMPAADLEKELGQSIDEARHVELARRFGVIDISCVELGEDAQDVVEGCPAGRREVEPARDLFENLGDRLVGFRARLRAMRPGEVAVFGADDGLDLLDESSREVVLARFDQN